MLVPFETNSRGLRDKEYRIRKPENTFRVAVVGDSFTMPVGVRTEEAYHSLLENRLNREQRDCSYEFINFAVGAYCLKQYWAVIRDKADPYDPDLILLGFFPANDYAVPPKRLFNRPFKPREVRSAFFKSFALFGVKRFHLYLKGKKERDTWLGGGHSESRLEYVEEVFSKIGEYSRRNRVPVLVVQLALSPAPQDPVRAIVESEGMHFADVSFLFEGKRMRDYILLPINSHPNAEANKLFADEIHDFPDDAGLLNPRREEGFEK